MSKQITKQAAPIAQQAMMAVLSFAGNKIAAAEGCRAALVAAVVQVLRHGNQRPFTDTLECLVGKSAKVLNIYTLTSAVHTTALSEFVKDPAQRPSPKDCAERGEVIVAAEWAAFEARALVAADESAVKRAEAAKVKAKEAAKAERAAAAAVKQAAAKPATPADIVGAFTALCASGNDVALAALESLAAAHLEAVETTNTERSAVAV